MLYSEWFTIHGKKHQAIMKKLSHLNKEEVIAYFRFENMVEKELDFCLLYQDNKKCHDIENLNCYLCACPHFRFDDDGLSQKDEKTLYSTCAIDTKEGAQFTSDVAIHQDCSKCTIPHHEASIKKVFDKDWFEIMKNVC